MPALTLHLLSLTPNISPKHFIAELKTSSPTLNVVVASRPRRVIISPTIVDKNILLTESWDLLLLLQNTKKETERDGSPFPKHLASNIRSEYSINVGIPSKLLNTYPERDAELKRQAGSVPLTGSLDSLGKRTKDSSQDLEISPDLVRFMDEFTQVYDRPVTMLNLLHFVQPGGKEAYFKYGQGFTRVASKRGGNAKLVGNVISQPAGRNPEGWWNEISIVHYPSIRHFCDMLAAEDYQEVNRRYRLGALKDTFLLCTTEFDLEGGEDAKL